MATEVALKKASEHYIECRREVSAKFNEIKALDEEIKNVYEKIKDMGDNTKSIGRLQITIADVEGTIPVDGAIINIMVGPEGAIGLDTETKQQEQTSQTQENMEETTKNIKTSSQTIAWKDVTESKTIEFEPVVSREAFVNITIMPPSDASNNDTIEPIQEVEFAVSSLMRGDALDKWYSIKDVQEADEQTTITEVKDEEAESEETTVTTTVKSEVTPSEKEGIEVVTTVTTVKTVTVNKEGDETTTTEVTTETEEVDAGTRKPYETEDSKTLTAEEKKKIKAANTATSNTTSSDETNSRFHVIAKLELSEIEKLNVKATTLSKQKHETEEAMSVLEREAASLRTKYDRLLTSQRTAANLAKAKGSKEQVASLVGGRNRQLVEKSSYEKTKDAITAFFTPNRQQQLLSFAMFIGGVAVFHFHGEKLLA